MNSVSMQFHEALELASMGDAPQVPRGTPRCATRYAGA